LHAGNALRSGDITADQMDEWVIALAHYAGWPVAANVYVQTRPVLAEHRANGG
jgi:alkylhydroperoxidase/carboxymuconolactone decarboxylase family protein YurZ